MALRRGDVTTVGAEQPRRGRAAALLAVASLGANGLAYLMSLVLSRALGPEDYGAMAALLSLGVIGSVPAQAAQFLGARRCATDPGSRLGTSTAWTVGALTAAAAAVLSLPAAAWLSLPSAWDLALLGLVLMPLSAIGVHQGWLLGHERTAGYAVLLVALTGGRLLVVGAALAVGGGVTACLLAMAVATWATWLATHVLLRRGVGGRGGPRTSEVLTAVSTVACVLVLTNVDVVLARVLLGPQESGVYAVASLFARVAFWAPYAVALILFPLAAKGADVLRKALAATVLVGLAVALLAAVAAGPFIRLTSGPEYAAAAQLAPAMAILGTAGAALQLLLLHSLARRDRVVELLAWTAAAVEVSTLLLLRPTTATGVLTVALLVQLVSVAVAAVAEVRRAPREVAA